MLGRRSPPARVAWIETPGGAALWQTLTVATREGGVDRNIAIKVVSPFGMVSPPARVAWIETQVQSRDAQASGSPPARVAWIETYTAV